MNVEYTVKILALRKKHNPDNEPTGCYTGRCGNCHSKNLQDLDPGASLHYECLTCGWASWSGKQELKPLEQL